MRNSVLVMMGMILISQAVGCSKKDSGLRTSPVSGFISKLDTVAANFSPKSLDFEGATPASASEGTSATKQEAEKAGASDPCAGYNIFSCQPVLLRLYIQSAKDWTKIARNLVENTGQHMSKVSVGSKATVDAEGQSITFHRISDSDYKILVRKNNLSTAYFDVTGNSATIKIASPPGVGSSGPAGIEIKLAYTDDNHWSFEGLFVGIPCNNNDVRAPERFRVKMSKNGETWQGKASMYNGIWATFSTTPTCSTTPSDNRSAGFYTDFVGDDTAAKAKVFVVKRTVDAVTGTNGIENFPLSAICTTYSSTGGQGELNCTGMNPQPSTYANPFCNPASTDVAIWNNDCAAQSSKVSSASFGPGTDWLVPTQFVAATVTLPTELG